jgi:hypothetical protein
LLQEEHALLKKPSAPLFKNTDYDGI